jgi:TP901 family phage tail tape measure protein
MEARARKLSNNLSGINKEAIRAAKEAEAVLKALGGGGASSPLRNLPNIPNLPSPSTSDSTRAAEQLQRQRSNALISQWRAEEREFKRIEKEKTRTVEREAAAQERIRISNAMRNARLDEQRIARDSRSIGGFSTGQVLGPVITGAIVAAPIKAAIDFESAFAGVRKTVNASEPELQRLRQGFRDLAKDIPISVNELARIGESAGQLGVKSKDILSFTRVMADLSVTTNLSSDQAATALARFANIIKNEAGPQFDRLGSTIVALGNNMATTEAEIVEMGLRIAGAGKQVGLTESQILGIGAALSSVGIDAEAGGSSISKVLVGIASAVESGGKELDRFAAIAGVTADEFKRKFQTDAAGALVQFIAGLDRVKKAGGDVFGTLESVGIQEVRTRDAVLRLAGAGDILTRSLDIANKGWSENTALTKEAEQRYQTTASKLQIFKNHVVDVAISVGDKLLPIVNALLAVLINAPIPVGLFVAALVVMNTSILTSGGIFARIIAQIALFGKVMIGHAALVTGAGTTIATAALGWLALAAGVAYLISKLLDHERVVRQVNIVTKEEFQTTQKKIAQTQEEIAAIKNQTAATQGSSAALDAERRQRDTLIATKQRELETNTKLLESQKVSAVVAYISAIRNLADAQKNLDNLSQKSIVTNAKLSEVSKAYQDSVTMNDRANASLRSFLELGLMSKDAVIKLAKAYGATNDELRGLSSSLEANNSWLSRSIPGFSILASQVDNTASSVRGLRNELAGLAKTPQEQIDKAVTNIVKTAKNRAEAARMAREALKDESLNQAVKEKRRLTETEKAARDVFEPSSRGGGGGGARRAANEADSATQSVIKQLEIQVQASNRAYKEEIEGARRAYEQRSISLEEFTTRQIAWEEARSAATLKLLKEELAQAETIKKGRTRDLRVAEINEKILQAESDTRLAIQRIQDDADKKQVDSLRSQRDTLLAISELYDQRELDRIRAAGEAGFITQETMELELQQRMWEMHEGRQAQRRIELAQVGQNVEEQNRIKLELRKAENEYANFYEGHLRRLASARQKDLENVRQHNRQIADLEIALTLSSIDNERARLDTFEKLGASSRYLQNRRDDLDYQEEIQRGLQQKLSIIREQSNFKMTGLSLERRKEVEDLFHQQLELAERAHQDRLEEIRLRPLERYREKLLSIVNGVVDAFGSAFDGIFQKGQSFFKNLTDGFKNLFLGIVKSYFLSGIRKIMEDLLGLNKAPAGQGGGGGGGGGGGFNLGSIIKGIFGGLFGGNKSTTGASMASATRNGNLGGIPFLGSFGASALGGSGRVGAGFGFGMDNKTMLSAIAGLSGGGITAPQSISDKAAQQSQAASVLKQAAGGGLSGIFGGGGARGFSLAGLGSSLGPMLPLMGLGLGMQLGGSSGSMLGSIVGGAGGLLAGGIGAALLAPGLFGVVPGAVTVAGSSSAAFMSGLYGFLSNPITMGVAAAALVAAYFINRSAQRRKEEKVRDQVSHDTGTAIWQLIGEAQAGKLGLADATTQFNAIKQRYFDGIAGIKDSKTKRIAVETWNHFQALWPILETAAKATDAAKIQDDKLIPEFSMGGLVPYRFGQMTLIKVQPGELVLPPNDFKGGIVPGKDMGRDSVFMYARPKTRILTRAQQRKQGVQAFAMGGTFEGDGSTAFSPGGGIMLPVHVTVINGKQEMTEVIVEYLNTSDGSRKVTRTVANGFRNGVS